MTRQHRVLVADDSPTARALLSGILDTAPELTVVGEAVDGADAVRLTNELRPSIVVMDIDMPRMDGLEATRRIMVERPTPILIVTGGYDADYFGVSLQAVQAGALTLMPKPAGPSGENHRTEAARLVRLVTALADVRVVRQHGRRTRTSPATMPVADGSRRSVEVVGVAASTGGPAVLYRLLQLLPATVDVPLVVVQHIADGFVDGLVTWLDTASPRSVRVAADKVRARGDEVYVAPDDWHLWLRDGRLHLSQEPTVGGFRPSADVLLGSLARSYGDAAAAVVLSGMGRDGLEGAAQVRTAGGLVLAQDADTSAVFGMPGAVVSAGLAHVVGPVEALARKISLVAKEGRC